MSNKKKFKTFGITGKLSLNITINISAESLEDALEKSRKLQESDFVDILGEWGDGGLNIEGIFEDTK